MKGEGDRVGGADAISEVTSDELGARGAGEGERQNALRRTRRQSRQSTQVVRGGKITV